MKCLRSDLIDFNTIFWVFHVVVDGWQLLVSIEMVLVPDWLLPSSDEQGEDDDLARFHNEDGEEEIDHEGSEPLVGFHLAELHPVERHQGHRAQPGGEAEGPALKYFFLFSRKLLVSFFYQ